MDIQTKSIFMQLAFPILVQYLHGLIFQWKNRISITRYQLTK